MRETVGAWPERSPSRAPVSRWRPTPIPPGRALRKDETRIRARLVLFDAGGLDTLQSERAIRQIRRRIPGRQAPLVPVGGPEEGLDRLDHAARPTRSLPKSLSPRKLTELVGNYPRPSATRRSR